MSEITNNIRGGVKGNTIFGDGNGQTMNYIETQTPAPPEPDQIGFKDSLTQLQKAVEAEPKFSQEQKLAVLEQLKSLEEAVKNPNETEKKTQAAEVAQALKWTMKMLSPAGQFVEACNNLFPLITKVFGL